MAYWAARCPCCKEKFVHTKIEPEIIEEAVHYSVGILPKPTITEGNQKRFCPHCQTQSVFKPFHLFYCEDRDSETWQEKRAGTNSSKKHVSRSGN